MLKHTEIWRAIDRLAEINGFSTSGLAREAGLDATTFNKSKRVGDDGKKRWPSTESLAKILQATNTDIGDFIGLVNKSAGAMQIPAISFADAGKKGRFGADGKPAGTGWASTKLPGATYASAFGLIAGKGLEPCYRQGDLLVVAPEAELRKGDRVAVITTGGEVMVRTFIKAGSGKIELGPLAGSGAGKTLPAKSISVTAKIVFVRPI